jgi:hypothetical protein
MPTIYRLTRAEQETVLRWDHEAELVHVWSASPRTWRKLDRLGILPCRQTTHGGRVSGRFYVISLARFRWGLKRRLRPRIPRSLQGRPENASSNLSAGRPAISPLWPDRQRTLDLPLPAGHATSAQ